MTSVVFATKLCLHWRAAKCLLPGNKPSPVHGDAPKSQSLPSDPLESGHVQATQSEKHNANKGRQLLQMAGIPTAAADRVLPSVPWRPCYGFLAGGRTPTRIWRMSDSPTFTKTSPNIPQTASAMGVFSHRKTHPFLLLLCPGSPCSTSVRHRPPCHGGPATWQPIDMKSAGRKREETVRTLSTISTHGPELEVDVIGQCI